MARHSLCSLLQLHGILAPFQPVPPSHESVPSNDQQDSTVEVDCIDDIVLELEDEGGNGQSQSGTTGGVVGEGDGGGLSQRQHVMFTLALWGSSLLLSLVVSDLHIILALTGAVAASFLAYILPSLIYLKTYEAHFAKTRAGFDPSSNHYQPSLFRRFRKLRRYIFPFCLLTFGILSLIIGVGTVIFEVLS